LFSTGDCNISFSAANYDVKGVRIYFWNWALELW